MHYALEFEPACMYKVSTAPAAGQWKIGVGTRLPDIDGGISLPVL